MKELRCPKCECDLREWGIALEAINHYKPDHNLDKNKFILNDISNLPYQDSSITCGYCNEEIDIDLLDIEFII